MSSVTFRGRSLAVAVLAIVGALSLWTREQLLPVAPGDASTQVFEIRRGTGVSEIGRALKSAGLLAHPRAFALLARLRGADRQIQAGEYELSSSMTPAEILARMQSGRVKTYTVVLPEGICAREVAERLEAAGLIDASEFLALAFDPAFAHSLGIEAPSLEGYLYPETYHLARNLPVEAVVRVLFEQFTETWSELEPLAKATGLSRHQVVTLASIVEKETAAPDERPVIAGVFLNRLSRKMRLETDPTVIYGIEGFDGNLRKIHLEDPSNLYNTYLIAGLPPGPIASPGRAALEAVVKPAKTDYLFFVSRNDGTHVFSRTHREHLDAVDHFQKKNANRRRQAP